MTYNPSFDQEIDSSNLDLWQIKKKKRMEQIIGILRQRKKNDKMKFLGEMSVKYGIRRETTMSYLIDLEDFGLITLTSTEIIWKENNP